MNFYKVFLKKNLVSLIIMLALALLIIISMLFFIWELREKNIVENRIQSKLKLFNLFKQKQTYAPTKSWIDYSKREKQQLTDIYKQIAQNVDKPAAYMPEKAKEPLKFKEEIFEVQGKLIQKAKSANLVLDEEAASLGFKKYEKRIPAKKEVPELTKKLNIAKELVTLLVGSKTDTLKDIQFQESYDKTLDSGKPLLYKIIPIKLTTVSSTKALVNFLYLLSKSEYVFVVNDININKSSKVKNGIQANLDISTVVFLKKQKKVK